VLGQDQDSPLGQPVGRVDVAILLSEAPDLGDRQPADPCIVTAAIASSSFTGRRLLMVGPAVRSPQPVRTDS
jgi:hypothetical protein